MTRVWKNNKISSVGNNQSEFLILNSMSKNNTHAIEDPDLDNDTDLKNDIILDEVNDTNLRKIERLANQYELSNVKIFIKKKLHNKR